jgi:glycogen debranching enzyme
MRAKVEERFWMDEECFYGLAIDGQGELCRVRASNPGHLLYAGLPSRKRAVKVAHCLTSPAFDSGWGIRTLAPGEARFNPMSYHDGSVWPHDTSLCVYGLARYGERQGVVRLFNQMFEAAVSFGMRLPELFCGFPRRPGEPPIAYPVACLPQAWAAGSFFMILQACLGLTIDGWRGEIHIDRPRLPIGIDHLELHGLEVGGKMTNLIFQRVDNRIVAFNNASSRIPLVIRV